MRRERRLKSIRKDKRGFTGLEAAIVLTAFVVVAAVFSYVVLNAGFFTTQKSKEVVHTGVEQATTSAELTGSVIGYSMTQTGDILTSATSGTRLNATRFYLQLTAGENPIDMEGVTISYNDMDTHVGSLTYNASAGGAQITSSSTLGLKPGEWNYTILTPSATYGDTDTLLEFGEKAQITVALPEGGVVADQKFSIELKPARGANVAIERTAPSAIDAVMDLL